MSIEFFFFLKELSMTFQVDFDLLFKSEQILSPGRELKN